MRKRKNNADTEIGGGNEFSVDGKNFYELSFRYSYADEKFTALSVDGKPCEQDGGVLKNKALSFVTEEKDKKHLAELLKTASPDKDKAKHLCKLSLYGGERWYLILFYFSFDGGKPAFADGKIVDVNDEYSEVPTLRYNAYHDNLTGLYRQNYSKEIILEKLKDASKNYALCIFDIDYFKGINDCYGHQFGDKMLQYVSSLAKADLKSDQSGIVARIGGDEFLAFIEYGTDAEPRVKKFHKTLLGSLDGVDFSVSMGAAVTAVAGRDYDTLYRHADQSLYASKRFGRGICCFYDPSVTNGLFSNNPFKRK